MADGFCRARTIIQSVPARQIAPTASGLNMGVGRIAKSPGRVALGRIGRITGPDSGNWKAESGAPSVRAA